MTYYVNFQYQYRIRVLLLYEIPPYIIPAAIPLYVVYDRSG